jgi:uncharacterized membrane protein
MTQQSRLAIVDALRGFAVAQMIVFHFIFDLDHLRFIDIAMTRDQPWVGWRTAIVSQFLLIAGASLVLRAHFRPAWSDFWRRWAQVAGAAALVSAGSWTMFGPRFIYFGILHFIAAALIVARLSVPLGRLNFALAAAVLLIWWQFAHPALNVPGLNIIGLVTEKPRTVDYVPLFPWLAAVFAGVGAGCLWRERGFALSPWPARLNQHAPRLLVLLGTWALTVYLVHQPLLLGLLWPFRPWPSH